MSAGVKFEDVGARALGHWPAILGALGIEIVFNRHGTCPGCGGVDRFRFDDQDGRGTFICGGGGAELLAGDGFDLVCHVRGCSAREALEAVAGVIGDTSVQRSPAPPSRGKASPGARAYGLELWLRACRDDAEVAQHPYLIRKGFQHAHGGGVVEGVRSQLWQGPESCLLVPIRAHGTEKVIAVQAITGAGQKVTFGSMTAEDGSPGYLVLGNTLDLKARLLVAEGWADIVSLVFLAYRGNAAGAIAFGKSRLDRVAEQFRTDMRRMPVIVEDSK